VLRVLVLSGKQIESEFSWKYKDRVMRIQDIYSRAMYESRHNNFSSGYGNPIKFFHDIIKAWEG